MRWFTLIVSSLFIVCGVLMIAEGDSTGWLVLAFFGCCLLVATFEPWLSKPSRDCGFTLLLTEDEIACEDPRERRESIRWDAVVRVWYVTTSEGPWLPDEWLLFEGVASGCACPTEAAGFDAMWDGITQHFPGFAYGPMIEGGTHDARHLCWEKQEPSAN